MAVSTSQSKRSFSSIVEDVDLRVTVKKDVYDFFGATDCGKVNGLPAELSGSFDLGTRANEKLYHAVVCIVGGVVDRTERAITQAFNVRSPAEKQVGQRVGFRFDGQV